MFTTPCYVKVDEDNEDLLKKYLREIGYNFDSDYKSCEGYPAEYLITYTNEMLKYCTDYRRNFNGMYHLTRSDILESYREHVDCGINIELFKAIAALDNYSDKHQWFTDGYHWEICPEHKADIQSWFDKYEDIPHKATLEELKEHFKQ